MKEIFKQSLAIIQENPGSYLLANFFYYGIFAAGLIYAYVNPHLYEVWHDVAMSANKHGWQFIVHDAYFENRNVVLAILLTFTINVFLGAAIHISLSSMIVPFLGCFIAAARAFLWGVIFGPQVIMAKPSILILIALEGQGYILAAFGAYLQSIRFIRPRRFNLSSHKEGFVEGAKLTVRIYTLVVLVLLVSAFFEVFLSGTLPQNPFPKLTDPQFSLHLPGATSSVDFESIRLSYDSTKVKLSDAKIAAVALRDVGYTGSIAVSQGSTGYQIRISLPADRWKDPEVTRRLVAAVTSLKKPFLDRHYEILACSEDSLGIWREDVIVQK